MSESNHPGVFIRDTTDGPRTIEGVSTDIAGFVGQTKRGPNTAHLIANWTEFREVYGRAEDTNGSFLPVAVRGFFENGGLRLYVRRVATNPEKPPDASEYIRALADLEAIGEISILAAPDEVNPRIPFASELTTRLVQICERTRDRIALFSIHRNQTEFDPAALHRNTGYGAVFHPWILVANPNRGHSSAVPPVGHVAGILARTGVREGVQGSQQREEMKGVIGVDHLSALIATGQSMSTQTRKRLESSRVNVIRAISPGITVASVRGAWTLTRDCEPTSVATRRLLIFIERSVTRELKWASFEPTSPARWAQIRSTVRQFLFLLWRNGALSGSRAEDAFFVSCGHNTMTQNDINNGRLILELGIAPVRPKEFTVVRVNQATADFGL